MDERHSVIAQPVLKVGTVWALIGITSWAEAAAFLGALYSALLIGEWLWKKAIRPLCVIRGWIKNPIKNADDYR